MRRRVAGWIGCVVLGVLLVACTGDDDGESAEGDDATTASTETAIGADTVAPTTSEVAVEEAVYAADFETAPGPEWSIPDIATTPSGDRSYLGPFDNDQLSFTVSGLPDHDAIVIEFDLFITEQWDGTARWRLQSEENWIVDTGFSNDPDGTQYFPNTRPYGRNDGLTGAVEEGTLGYESPAPGIIGDSVYRIERSILHDAEQAVFTFIVQGLGEEPVGGWGLDNVRVLALTTEAEAPSTELVFDIVNGEITTTGVVPSADEQQLLTQSLDNEFGDRVASVELEQRAGPPPAWLYEIGEIVRTLSLYGNLRAELGEDTATVTGSAATPAWIERIGGFLRSTLGERVDITIDLEPSLDEEVAAELAEARVFFGSADAELDGDDRATLDRVVVLLTENDSLVVQVQGHTDGTGEQDENRDLGRRRAFTVNDYLVEAGIEADRLVVKDFLDQRPDEEGNTSAALAANRRVSFEIVRG